MAATRCRKLLAANRDLLVPRVLGGLTTVSEVVVGVRGADGIEPVARPPLNARRALWDRLRRGHGICSQRPQSRQRATAQAEALLETLRPGQLDGRVARLERSLRVVRDLDGGNVPELGARRELGPVKMTPATTRRRESPEGPRAAARSRSGSCSRPVPCWASVLAVRLAQRSTRDTVRMRDGHPHRPGAQRSELVRLVMKKAATQVGVDPRPRPVAAGRPETYRDTYSGYVCAMLSRVSKRVQVILDKGESEIFRHHAAREGLSLSAWLRAAGRARLSTVARSERLDSVEDLRSFFAACDAREGGTEPDWEQHESVIEVSRAGGRAAS